MTREPRDSSAAKSYGASLRIPDDVAFSFSTSLPHHITFAGSREAMLALSDCLARLASELEADHA